MKIGILIDELVSGGFQKVAIMEVKYFNTLGHDASLLVLHRIKDEGYQDLIRQNNIPVVHLSDRLPFFLKLNFKFPFFAFFSFFHVFYPGFIWRYIKYDNFNVLLAHGTYTIFSAIPARRRLKIPCISFIHDSVAYIIDNKYQSKLSRPVYLFLSSVARKIDKKIIRNSDVVLAFPDMITEMKKIMPAYLGYREIFNGCEILPEGELNFNKSDFAIAVTKWDQGKNFSFLLDLWTKLDKKIELKIIGSFHPADLKIEMKKMIDEHHLGSYIELVGEVTEEILSQYYREAKFLIHPCREAFGMTILEASANGCPAVFTRDSGVAELYSESIKDVLPVENNLNQYEKMVDNILQMSKTDYENLVRIYYIHAIKNSWIQHCNNILKLLPQIL